MPYSHITWQFVTERHAPLTHYVRVVLLDVSKAFDLINHHILVDKLITNGVPAHIVRGLAAFLLDRQQQIKIGNIYIHVLVAQMVECHTELYPGRNIFYYI